MQAQHHHIVWPGILEFFRWDIKDIFNVKQLLLMCYNSVPCRVIQEIHLGVSQVGNRKAAMIQQDIS